MIAELLDAAILVWLIGTWFYEGHHRRCTVVVTCRLCKAKSTKKCKAGKHDA